LRAAESIAFKVWRLSRKLQIAAAIGALGIVGLAILAWDLWWTRQLPSITFGFLVICALFAVTVTVVLPYLQKLGIAKTIGQMAIGFGMWSIGWLFARLHLHVFDRIFLFEGKVNSTIAALAGRRVDTEGTAPPVFPPEKIENVSRRITERLKQKNSVALVSSAACGADLLALQAAQSMGIRTVIVLPFAAHDFKLTSVIDRSMPEFWGQRFDSVVEKAREKGDVIELQGLKGDDAAYRAANKRIMEEARRLAKVPDNESRPDALIAFVVWDGTPRNPDDTTKSFADLAQNSGFKLDQIGILQAN
jgi:hypothetical protein